MTSLRPATPADLAPVRALLATAGLRAIYLLTTTAAGYFPRTGFIPIGREAVPVGVRASSEFASTCPSSAAVMRLILDPRSTLSSIRKVTSP